MPHTFRRLPDSELAVMQALWDAGRPLTRPEIDAALAALRTLANGKASASAVSSLQSQMASKAEVVTGAYTGNGSTQTITLGFKPRAVVFYLKETESGVIFPGLESSIAAVTASGFTVTINTGYAYDTNKNGRAYAYLALK